ncbi:MAG: hypothetical protein IIV42_02490, partial [Peptococcaceae bacterium]|nr:hypothetical protein [Peptococcaceae bacterium]
VFASGLQGVLQDATGGIRLAFGSKPDIALGDVLVMAGHRSNSGFVVEEFEKTGTEELPALESSLEQNVEARRIQVRGAALGYMTLTQNGYSCQLGAAAPAGMLRKILTSSILYG